MSALDTRFLDASLLALSDQATALWACSADPGLDWDAIETGGIAVKLGVSISAPQPGTESGARRAGIQPFADGSWIRTGDATHWALVDGNSERVLASGIIDPPMGGAAGQTLALSDPIYITLPGVAPDPELGG